jgi:hypothetical protein
MGGVEDSMRELLEAADDPTDGDYPADYDWDALNARLARLRPKLEGIAGRSFVLDLPQDSTHHCVLEIQTPGSQPGRVDIVFALSFSRFGSLFTTWRNEWTKPLPDAMVTELVRAVSYAGFHYVPEAALAEPYTGPHEFATWWDRFFDYT